MRALEESEFSILPADEIELPRDFSELSRRVHQLASRMSHKSLSQDISSQMPLIEAKIFSQVNQMLSGELSREVLRKCQSRIVHDRTMHRVFKPKTHKLVQEAEVDLMEESHTLFKFFQPLLSSMEQKQASVEILSMFKLAYRLRLVMISSGCRCEVPAPGDTFDGRLSEAHGEANGSKAGPGKIAYTLFGALVQNTKEGRKVLKKARVVV
ncbi:hypothetical protein PCL_08344 [Purpureocillium lilacinum]|uniref:Uncharacterized protein n=1 Tax=Purpureocillium lilacinum TaxID=33203 RepID=A0A2U3DRX9_PURLI|nr:hypothetical protein PCL_08344 [Purpureocillium lilacinum]